MTALAPVQHVTDATEPTAITNPFPDDLDWLDNKARAYPEHQLVIGSDTAAKVRFFLFVARRGHLGLGDTNIAQYCDRLGISKSTGYRRIQAVTVGMLLEDVTPEQLLCDQMRGEVYLKIPTVQVAEMLCALPSKELILEACTRYTAQFTGERKPTVLDRGVNLTQLGHIISHLMPNPAVVVEPTIPNIGKNIDDISVIVPFDKLGRNAPEFPLVLPPSTDLIPPPREHSRFVAPATPEPTAEPEEDDTDELVFEGYEPDYIATDCEYSLKPAGHWISFTAPNGATETVFVREAQIVGAPTR